MELVSVRTFFHHIDADLARTALAAHGIQSMISADDAGGAWAGAAVRLMVAEADFKAADDVLAAEVDPPEE